MKSEKEIRNNITVITREIKGNQQRILWWCNYNKITLNEFLTNTSKYYNSDTILDYRRLQILLQERRFLKSLLQESKEKNNLKES